MYLAGLMNVKESLLFISQFNGVKVEF